MKKRKDRFHMLQNSMFMVRTAWFNCKSVLVIVALSVLFQVTLSLLELFVVPSILNTVETAEHLSELIFTILLFSLGMILSSCILDYLRTNSIFGRINVRVALSRMFQNKLCRTSYPNTENPDFLKEMESCVNVLNNNSSPGEAIWDTLTELLKNLICFGIYLTIITSLDPLLVIITLITSAASYFTGNHFNSWANRHRDESAKYSRQMNYICQKAVDRYLAKDIRIFQLGPWLKELHQRAFSLYQDFCKREQRVYIAGDFINALFTLLRNGIAYLWLIHITLTNGLSASEFLLYFTAITGFTNWIIGILSQLSALYRQSLDLSVFREFLDYEETFSFEEGKAMEPRNDIPYEITLSNVSFRYPGAKKDTLSHINLTIKPGEKLAVVGLNGAGKTTLIKLICGFYDPTEGAVLLNGQDIRQYNRRDYYRHFSAVFQNFSILPGSIAENVAQSQNIDRKKVLRCLKKAGLSDKINLLSQGIDTKLYRDVFEDAVDLSGGELQKLMLARALYKESPIILLDEPTAALDPLAESFIYQKYQELTHGCTSVYISHRLASTRFCDRILLIENGVIAEEGTHESLLEKGGRYAELFEVQKQYYQENPTEGEIAL